MDGRYDDRRNAESLTKADRSEIKMKMKQNRKN